MGQSEASCLVKAQDRLANSKVWSQMEQLLSGHVFRHLTEMLPPLASIPAWHLPGIARIHMQSAFHIKIMMRSLAPEAFAVNEAEPVSMDGFARMLPPSKESLVLALIDLQIFHLLRVREVVAHMRMNAQARRVCMDMCAAAAGDGQQQQQHLCHRRRSSSATGDGSAEEALE